MERNISYLPILFHSFQKMMMEEHETIVESYDLTKKHIPFLMVIGRFPEGLTQQEISEKMRMDKAHTSRTLRELEEKGYVIKEGEGTYKHKYLPTEKSKQMKKLLKEKNDQIVSKVLSVLTDDEVVQFETIIRKLTDEISHIQK
ncbi:MAG: MarR family winged helix-turn-helix transcriptional regulator [Candidatus Izemoplasmatales bacterium]